MSGLSVYDEDEDDLWNIGVSVNVAIAPTAEETLPNLWEDYGKKEPEIPKEDIVCRVHGKICPKGICKQRKSQEKELEKKKREAGRAQGGKKKKDKPWRVANDTDNNGARGDKIKFQSRQKPPHLAESASSPTVEDPPPANSPNTARGKPPHLGKSSPTEPAPVKPTAPAARPARGRRMNTNTDGPVSPSSPSNETANAAQTRNLRSDARSVAASSSGGWGPPVDLWAAVSVGRAATIKNDDTRSVAASSNGGWGPPVDIYSGAPSLNERRAPPAIPEGVNTVKQGSASTVKKSWADEMEEDDAHSVVESVNGGWGTISNSPWS
ncbi:hypothetical protein PHLCEN_2v5219 [Hermanssonia centrifuga]|uniref:Uncharacterized protein n=1 Tax=Hermanssonia centrifuga TaxID=98765 RepID=A0A2R6P8U0_9APHY|nr:hypothetical protein PHLCEN_2v5219 [Hermanssonia centrifuga]